MLFKASMIPWDALAWPLLAFGALMIGQKVLGWGFALLRGIFKSKRRGRGLVLFLCLSLPLVGVCQDPPPPSVNPAESSNMLLWGFASSVIVFGSLFAFHVVKKSIFRGLDLIERD